MIKTTKIPPRAVFYKHSGMLKYHFFFTAENCPLPPQTLRTKTSYNIHKKTASKCTHENLAIKYTGKEKYTQIQMFTSNARNCIINEAQLPHSKVSLYHGMRETTNIYILNGIR